ncbi:ribosome maturation factor RimM [Lactobacillus hamsteri]|uniref:Ribosome maturation factor RimM n=1 Tax=Lactobacillus hamsteri DSM 5661 = JCM 6256 TaxID=1423754 RepID=A0A0R1YG64_9LACO|nr:ribosome maturation factor RimM [Lactobacillus hamsteri]KRM41242.1 16S rRNA processing protein [Lactobacillus hamsteri DSM 5661 = JCM 6256]
MQYYDVAKIINTHGLNGELKVSLITDFPEERFSAGSELALKDDTDRVLTVKKGRPFKQFWLVEFEEITDIDQAEKLKGKTLVISEANQQELPEGVYYYRDIMGCQVIDNDSNEEIGEITDIESPGANDIWLVKEKNGNEFWLPYIKDVVKKVDVENKKIYVELMEGLRDED